MQIPFAQNRVAPQVQSMPRGSMDAAAAPWRAVAQVGGVISDLGEKGMSLATQIQQKKVQLSDNAAAASYDATKELEKTEVSTFLLKNKEAGIETTPEMLREIRQKYDATYSNQISQMSERTRTQYDPLFSKDKEIRAAMDNNYFLSQSIEKQIGTIDSSVAVMASSGNIEGANKYINDNAVILGVEKANAMRESVRKQGNIFLDSQTIAIANKNLLDRNFDSARTSIEPLKTRNPVLYQQTLTDIETKERAIKVSDTTLLRNDAIALGDTKAMESHNITLRTLGQTETEVEKGTTSAILTTIKADDARTIHELNQSESAFKEYSKNLNPSSKLSVQKYLDSKKLSFRNEAVMSLQQNVEKKNTSGVEQMRQQMVDNFGADAGNLYTDQAISASKLGVYSAEDIQNSLREPVKEGAYEEALYGSYDEKARAIKESEWKFRGGFLGAMLLNVDKKDFESVSAQQKAIVEDKVLSFPQKNTLLNVLMGKLVPDNASPEQRTLTDMFNRAQNAVPDTNNLGVWNDFFTTTQAIEELKKNGKEKDIPKVILEYNDRMESVKVSANILKARFETTGTLKNAISTGALLGNGAEKKQVMSPKEKVDKIYSAFEAQRNK